MSRTSSRCIALPGHVLCVVFSPDGRFLAASGTQPENTLSQKGFLRVYDAQTLELLQVGPPSDFSLPCLAWSPDSQRLAFTGPSGTVTVWDHIHGTVLCTYYGHSPEVSSLPLDSNPVRREVLALCWPTNQQIISVGKDTCLCQWNPHGGETLRRSVIYRDLPEHFSFSPNGEVLAVFACAPPEQDWRDIGDPFLEDDLQPGNGFAADPRGKVCLYDASIAQMTAVLPGTEDTFFSAWSPTSDLLALGAWDEIQIWDLQAPAKPRLMHRIARQLFGRHSPSCPSQPLAWTPGGEHLAYCARFQEDTARASHWYDNLHERALIEIVDAHTGTIVYSTPVTNASCLDWNPDGKQLVIGREMEYEVITDVCPCTSARASVAP